MILQELGLRYHEAWRRIPQVFSPNRAQNAHAEVLWLSLGYQVLTRHSRNLVTSLIEHEQIKTTLPKARDAARLAEKVCAFRFR